MYGSGQPRWNSVPPNSMGQAQQPAGGAPWSLDPSHYTQIPHHQVDWASLAQQWIQMKGTDLQQQQHQGHGQEMIPPPPPMPPTHHQHGMSSIQTHQNPQLQHNHDVIGEAPMDLDDSVSAPLYTRSSSIIAGGSLTTSPNMHSQLPQHSWPPPGSFPQHSDELHRVHSGFDHHGGNNYEQNSWPQRNPSLDMNSFNDRRFSANYSERRQSYQEEDAYEEDFAEAARRRALPSWIREGLEKVEREKRKAEEKERLATEREEERRLRRKRDQEQTETQVSQWEDDSADVPPPAPVIETSVVFGGDEELSIKLKGSFRKIQPPQHSLEEILASLSKDEQMEQVMLSVRRQLTKILLEVTNDEMRLVAHEAIERTRAKQKVTSSRGQSLVALTSLTGGTLGLGDYGSEDSDDQDSGDERDELTRKEDEIDSDAELIAEIQRKKRNFEMKLLAEDQDDDPGSGKSHHTSVVRKPVSRSRSKSGESLAGSNGKIVHTSNLPVPYVHITSDSEKLRGDEESKVDEKKTERRRSRDDDNRHRRSSSLLRRRVSSSKESRKHERAPSKERKRRDSRRHSRSSSSSDRNARRRRSRSSSKHRKSSRKQRSKSKDRKSDTLSKISKERRKSRSSSATRTNRRKSRSSSKSRKPKRSSRSPTKGKKDRRRSRSSSKSKKDKRRKSRSLSKSRKHKRSRSSSKSKKDKASSRRRRSRSKSSKRRSRSREKSGKHKYEKTTAKRSRRSVSSSSTRSSSSSTNSSRIRTRKE